MARFLCWRLQSDKIFRAWPEVFEYLNSFTAWEEYSPVEDYDLSDKHWACVAGRVFKELPWRLTGVKQSGLHCYAAWYWQPLPNKTFDINGEDFCFVVSLEREEGCTNCMISVEILRDDDVRVVANNLGKVIANGLN